MMKLTVAFRHFENAPHPPRMPHTQSTSVGLPVTYGVNQLPGIRLHEQAHTKQEANGFFQSYLLSL
jgi:hypothetical protein